MNRNHKIKMMAFTLCGVLMMIFPQKAEGLWNTLGISKISPKTVLREIAISRLPLHVPKALASSGEEIEKADSSRTEGKCTCIL
ncbi:hypothetical protein [Echinicola vietnamensis]|uniref:Uncharacterized protein n=1 Tax=Echinicola vietnamensis (strain DSM 17526 / LMG 23754 / KMM 6221) TaxID=926556 RepID=L0G2W5_ECHVK|nr:hypothetical protein [Echinicola vietnamensis]AGA79185.1 hypothetical protein Echvi_2947 [Echinicola vietnamensis DSM 17526]